jgi:hypothetical protein
MNMSKIKIAIELVPKNCQFSNVRSTVKTSEWNKLRFYTYEQAEGKCEVCKEKGKTQGFKHDIECHEIWEYDDKNKVQRLVGLIALCPKCHNIKHIGRASAMGRQGQCFEHMRKVNNWNHLQVVTHMAESYELQKIRSKFIYTLDLSILNEEPYNLTLDLNKERKFVKSKYVKKRRKQTPTKKPTTLSKRPLRKNT